ncbi:MAG: GGDEF domain-containing protein [Methylococcaceae bacterium]|nr:GGDEF domain-containing protein [Methylococcaceae bacterium]
MIQKTAHATNLASDPAFRGKDSVQEQQWKLSNSLQTTLDVDRLIELFGQAVQKTVGHNGYSYSHDREEIRIRGGIRARFMCSHRLVVEQEDIGEFQVMRRNRFSELEVSRIEGLISCLAYPLRNALMYRKALRLAHTDPLTQVNNRVAMEDSIRREWELARRQKSPLSLMLIDIDHFKSFNDRYGHVCGDQVLQSTARTIRETVRASDMIFRYGGEEFVVVLTNTEIAGAVLLAERIRRAIENMRIATESQSIRVTASLGVTALNPGTSARDLLVNADRAMYQAKQNGRNRVIKSL